MLRTTRRFACSTVAVLILVCSSPGQTPPTFTRNDISVGNSPVSLVIADFNGDGKPDVAVLANTVSMAIASIYLGNGDGTFNLKTSFLTGFASVWLTAGDLNADGKPELVVANGFSRSVSVYIGNGDGTFGPRSDISLPGRIESVLLADFNGDGKLDLAAPDFEPQPYAVSILLGNGDGTFGPNTEYPTVDVPFVVIADDFNHDGKLDLALNTDLGSLSAIGSVLLGNGDGTFQPKKDFSTGFTQSADLTSGDFNTDGKKDLVVANNADDSISILLGNGAGTFALESSIALPVTPFRVLVRDIDADGKMDLVVARRNSATVSILIGKGDGTFATPIDFGIGAGPQFIVVKDLNGDGKLDVITANYDDGTVSVLLNTSGATTPQISVFPTQITFPPTLINTTSSPVQVTLSNTGTANLVISDIATQDPFAISNPSPNIKSNIAPNTQGTFDVIFRPTTAGPFSGNVTILSNAPTSPTTISLQGTVFIPPPLPPVITSISPISGSQGQTIPNFTVKGSNFDPNVTLSFSGTGIRLKSPYTSESSTQIVADLTIDPNSPVGAQDVIVTNGNSLQGILPGAFAIQSSRVLVFPLHNKKTAFTAKISAVMDHHIPLDMNGGPLFYSPDGYVDVFTGDEGTANCTAAPPCTEPGAQKQGILGYKNNSGTSFKVRLPNYTGGSNCLAPCDDWLFYDGHTGFDYPSVIGTDVYAPASGIAFIPDCDPVSRRRDCSSGSPGSAVDGFNILTVDHGNGYSTWYLHMGDLETVKDESARIPGPPFQVAVANAALFQTNRKVVYAKTLKKLIQVSSNPSSGQYSINPNNGVYSFAAADTGKKVLISYSFASDYRVITCPGQQPVALHRGDGQRISVTMQCTIGKTGNRALNSTGVPFALPPHLHFEVRRGLIQKLDGSYQCLLPDCRPVDPYGWTGAPGKDPYPPQLGPNVLLWK